MEEKAKTKVLIYIIVILVMIILIISVLGIIGYKKLSEKIENNNVIQDDTNLSAKQVDEKLRITQNSAIKNILLNNKVKETKITETHEETDESNEFRKQYQVQVKVQIEGKETEIVESLHATYEAGKTFKMEDIVKDITTIKSEEGKDYIIIVLEEDHNPYTPGILYYYVVDENGKLLKKFEIRQDSGIILRDYRGIGIQLSNNYVIEYEAIPPTEGEKYGTLKKWKYTIQNNQLERVLEKTYQEIESNEIDLNNLNSIPENKFLLEGASW